MNNEEKILELLQAMQDDLSGVKAEQAEMKALLSRVAITQENIVLPRLEMLAEGHKNLLDTLAPKNRVEALENEVDFLKTVIQALSRDVAELKQAQ